jgi:hypothetical protein
LLKRDKAKVVPAINADEWDCGVVDQRLLTSAVGGVNDQFHAETNFLL